MTDAERIDDEFISMPHGAEGQAQAAALFEARTRHDRCDDIDFGATTDDGDDVVYCSNCGQVLLRWGGDA